MLRINGRANLVVYGTLFFMFMLLAGNGYVTANADANMLSLTGDRVDVVPVATPPGGTIPVVSTGISVLHLAPIGPEPKVSTVITSTIGITVASTGITVGERWAGSPIADSTNYLSFPSGDTNIAVLPDGSTTPILRQVIALNDDADNTIVLTGGANGWTVDTLLVNDSTSPPPPFFGKVRIVHVAPLDNASQSTALDVVEATGRAVDESFTELVYRDVSNYVTLPAGEYDWRANLLRDGSVIELEPFTLHSGAIATIYILGDGSSVQAAGLLIIKELGNVVRDMHLPIIIE